MGFLQLMFGRRGKDTAHSPQSSRRDQNNQTSTQPRPIVEAREASRNLPPAQTTRKHVKNFSQSSFGQNSTATSQQAEDSKSLRKSRRFSFGRIKADDTRKKRRSIFGAQVAVKAHDETPQVPAVPAMWQQQDRRGKPSIEELVRPGTALTVDASIPAARLSNDLASADRITRQLSLLEKPARKSSITRKPNTLQRKRSNRRSLFGGEADDDNDDDTPVLPAVPVKLLEQKSAEKRKSQVATVRVKHGKSRPDDRKSQRWSLFQSDDPKKEDEIIPSLPMLSHDILPMPHFTKSSYAPKVSYYSVHPNSAATVPRTYPALPQTYVPKGSAKAILDTTTTPFEEAPRNVGYSLMDDDETVSFLSPEQQREWDKLKLLMEALDARHDDDDTMPKPLEVRAPKSAADRYSNAKALAALEFGEAF